MYANEYFHFIEQRVHVQNKGVTTGDPTPFLQRNFLIKPQQKAATGAKTLTSKDYNKVKMCGMINIYIF